MRAAVAAMALLCALIIQPAAASPAAPWDGPYRVQMIYRATKSNAPLTITVRSGGYDDYSMWYFVELQRRGKGWINPDGVNGIADGGGFVYPTVYGLPTGTTPPCPDPPGCRYPVGFDASARFTVTPAATSRYYVVSTHDDTRVELDTKGWRVKDVPNPGIRRVFPEAAKATGIRLAGVTVEHFTSAAAPGGRYGSAVFASVPCGRGGVGSARLTARGIAEPRLLQCGLRTYGGSFWFTYSPVQTTWRLDGDVHGLGAFTSRLLVFDFPKP